MKCYTNKYIKSLQKNCSHNYHNHIKITPTNLNEKSLELQKMQIVNSTFCPNSKAFLRLFESRV